MHMTVPSVTYMTDDTPPKGGEYVICHYQNGPAGLTREIGKLKSFSCEDCKSKIG